ncbi:acyltransferase [uncultured Roseobacter sp.]|uniref:acyltransferase family protein n=1 Tax=uncultured Roseobacter sp. TaxID=114847 RepID=UPI0026233020|nr:acyltransferase [uncultured Roseobacter sp.]
MSAPSPRPKLTYIETLRGAACFGLVMYHVVGPHPQAGMELPSGHYLFLSMLLFVDFRMPLFSFISGYIFRAHVGSIAQFSNAVARKFRRLMVPMISVGTVYWLVHLSMGRSVPPYVELFYLPYTYLWFLPATFLIMTLFYGFNLISGNRALLIAGAVIVLAGGFWVARVIWTPNLFASLNALYIAPYFMCGYLWANQARMQALVDRAYLVKRVRRGLCVLLVGLLLVKLASILNVFEPSFHQQRLLRLFIGLSGCSLLLLVRPEISFLARIGQHSYAIFLFHVFFTGGFLEVVHRFWPTAPDLPVFAAGVAVGLTGPILTSALILRLPIAPLLFLGIRMKKKTPPVSQGRVS